MQRILLGGKICYEKGRFVYNAFRFERFEGCSAGAIEFQFISVSGAGGSTGSLTGLLFEFFLF